MSPTTHTFTAARRAKDPIMIDQNTAQIGRVKHEAPQIRVSDMHSDMLRKFADKGRKEIPA